MPFNEEFGTIQNNADSTLNPSNPTNPAFAPSVFDLVSTNPFPSVVEIIPPLPGANPGNPALPNYNPPTGAAPSIPSPSPPPPVGAAPTIPAAILSGGGGGGGGPSTAPRTPRARRFTDIQPGPMPGTVRVRMAGGEWIVTTPDKLNPTDRKRYEAMTKRGPTVADRAPPTKSGPRISPRSWEIVGTGILVAAAAGQTAYDIYDEYRRSLPDYGATRKTRVPPPPGADFTKPKRGGASKQSAAPAPVVNVVVNVPSPPTPPAPARDRKPLAVKVPRVKVEKAEPILMPLPQLPQSVPERIAKAVGKVAASPTVRTLLSLSSLAQLVPRSTQLRISQPRTNVDPITTNNLLQLQQGQPLAGSGYSGSGGSSNSRCRCTKKPKRERSSCRNPIVSKRSRTVDGRVLQTTTREITCPPSRQKRA